MHVPVCVLCVNMCVHVYNYVFCVYVCGVYLRMYICINVGVGVYMCV